MNAAPLPATAQVLLTAARQRPPENTGPPPAPNGRVNILLVDDRSDKLLALEAILEPLNQNIVKANSGKEALRHLLKQDVAVILLDVAMPGMSGFETAAMIRKRPRCENTPIIFITSISHSENHIHEGYSLGAVDYILTPVMPDVLRTKVSAFVELHRKSEEISKLNRELERRVHDLTEINGELESFSYSISHDLRAPLRSISSFAQMLRLQLETTLSSEGTDYLQRVENAAKYMDTLLMGLLEYSRLGRGQLELSPVNVDQAVHDVLVSIEREILSAKAALQIEKPLGLVLGHSAIVRQVLFNLIANALKFVFPDQPPAIRIWSEPQNKCIRIWVADHGIGIPTQYHKQIFGLFQRLHPQGSYPGTGIGLALVRKGVERMGGRVGLESEPRQGSRFWFELPAAL